METFLVTVASVPKAKLKVYTMLLDCDEHRAVFIVVAPDKDTVVSKVKLYLECRDDDRFTLDPPSAYRITERKDLLANIKNPKVLNSFVLG